MENESNILMNQSRFTPKTLENAFSMLEKGRSVEVETIDAVRILQNTQDTIYKVYFNTPIQGRSVIVPQGSE